MPETLQDVARELGFKGEPSMEELHDRVSELARDALIDVGDQRSYHRRIQLAAIREAAAKPGFFRACIGADVADAMASGTMSDENVLRVTIAHLEAIQKLP